MARRDNHTWARKDIATWATVIMRLAVQAPRGYHENEGVRVIPGSPSDRKVR